MLKEVESKNGSCGEPETAPPLRLYGLRIGFNSHLIICKKQTDEPSAFLYGAGEGNIPLSRPPSAPLCGLRTLTAVFWVFAYDRIHPDSPLSDYMACVSGSIPTSLYVKNRRMNRLLFCMEQVKGIEPSTQAWEARILPLNYTCRWIFG